MKISPTKQKLRGGYYTPRPIAEFLARWAIQSPDDSVLEPSCGNGEIAVAAAARLRALGGGHGRQGHVTAVELEASEANKARERLAEGFDEHSFTVIRGDFFEYSQKWGIGAPLFAKHTPFDAVVGNPPFIRYQNFPERYRTRATELMERLGFQPNRLTNAWVPFVAVATQLVKETGRFGFVLPSELLQVSYAAQIREFLSEFFERITLITFRDLIFGNIQQDTVLLLGERRASGGRAIVVFELDGVEDLTDLVVTEERTHPVRLDHSSEKWLQYFLKHPQVELIRSVRRHPSVAPLGQFAEVDVGLVTGENSFFVLTEDEAQQLELWPVTTRLVSRSAHVQGLRFADADWQECLHRKERVLLFAPPNTDKNALPKAAKRYVQHGERQGLNSGYKCRIRKRWWVVPSQWVPDAFGLRQVHMYPRIVLNDANAQVTDTLHRIRFKPNASPSGVACAFVNSLTLAVSEITGRGYGGGVLTFEPTEFEALSLPLTGWDQLDLQDLDLLIRTKGVYACLEVTDKILLERGLGLSRRDVLALRQSWETLRNRRVARRTNSSLKRAV